jgi:hypothetical protein
MLMTHEDSVSAVVPAALVVVLLTVGGRPAPRRPAETGRNLRATWGPTMRAIR